MCIEGVGELVGAVLELELSSLAWFFLWPLGGLCMPGRGGSSQRAD